MREYDFTQNSSFPVMDRRQVREFDRRAIEELKIPGLILMENAGRGCAELILEFVEGKTSPKVCIFCGGGNNGGDGFVIARHLFNTGLDVRTILLAKPARIGGDAKVNLDIILNMKLPVEYLNLDTTGIDAGVGIAARAGSLLDSADLAVDAILGTGFRGPLSAGYIALAEGINASAVPVVAVDIPSGLDCDTGRPSPVCIHADFTATFVAVKKGFAVNPGARSYTGRVFVVSIGVEPHGLERAL